jgi:hypothetical protein
MFDLPAQSSLCWNDELGQQDFQLCWNDRLENRRHAKSNASSGRISRKCLIEKRMNLV